MKQKHLLIVILLLASCSLTAGEIKVKHLNFNGTFPVLTPLKVNEMDVNGKSYSFKEIIESTTLLGNLNNTLHIVTADEQGMIYPGVSEENALNLYSFYAVNDRFQKGKLQIQTSGDYSVFIDRVLQKTANGKVELELEPRKYEIAIQYLAKTDSVNKFEVTLDFPYAESIRITQDHERYYTLKEVTDGKRIQSASISPDGKSVLIQYVEVLPGGERMQTAEVIDRQTGRVQLLLDGIRRSAGWMPRSNNALYYTRSGAHGKELIRLIPTNQHEEVLATNLPDGSFRFSPTEDFLLFTILEKGPEERTDIREVIVPDDRQPGWRNRYFIHKYDLKSGLMQRVTFGYQSTYINDISADGRFLLVSGREPFLTERPFSRTSIYRIDMQTLQTDTLFKSEKFIGRAQFSPDSRQLLISASGDAFDGIGLNIKEGQKSNTSDGQLFLYDLAQKKATALTKDFNPSVDRAVWNHFDNTIYLQAKDKDRVKLYTIEPLKKIITTLPSEEDVLSEFSLAAQAPELVYFGMSGSNSHRLYAVNTKKKTGKCLVDLSADIMRDIRLGELNDWNFVSEAGDTIYGRYYLPPHFDPAKKYPLIVNYYGGTTPTARVLESRYPSHIYATLGFVVYIVQPSGATGFGQEFSARHVNAWGKQTADEIIEGTKKFCEQHVFINKEKVGCMGASYGGFMTMYLQTKTDIFAAAMSHAGISDITSYWGEGYWGYSYSALATADSYPWNARDIYVEQSPLFHADKINTPILFLHGFADTNVPVGESIQMFTALKLLGKETALVEIPGQDHHILDYNKRIRWNNSIFAWFCKYLKDEPEWWDALYPSKNL